MTQDQWFCENIVNVPLREDEVNHQQQVQTIPPSSRYTPFVRGFLLFSELNNPDFFQQVVNFHGQSLLAQAISGPALGLRLQKTKSLVESVERRLNVADENKVQQKKEKLKAAHFPIAYLEIGHFKLTSLHEAHLVAKCYYAKRKLVWEILEGGLKKKIEILWHGISNIQALLPENQPGTLKILLQERPSFYRELGPTPKKHTIWKSSEDFTGHKASIFRKHLLVFEPGVLDKHYSKLLQCDENLHRLSLQPFPDLELPLFTLYQPSSSTPVPLLPPSTEQDQQFYTNNSTTSTLDISSKTEAINNNNQRLQDSKVAVLHGGYADTSLKDSNSGFRKQPFEFTHSPQKVHQFRDLITLPSPSNAINHSTSPALDLSAKNSMLSAKQQQPSSSTPAPMPSTQQVQQYRCLVTLPSPSHAINHSTSPAFDLSAKNSMLSAKQQQPSSSTPAPMPSTQQIQQFRCPVTLPSSLGINDSTLPSPSNAINHSTSRSFDLLAKNSMFSAKQHQPSSSTPAPMPSTQQVQQFRCPLTLPSPSDVINHSTSPAFDLLVKNSMFSAKQHQPSSSTPAPMPSTQQVQQFRCPLTLPSSFGTNNSTLPSPSDAINHSTSPAFDLSAKNSMLSVKQQQPSSSTPAPMPSIQQVQQFRSPVTSPSSLGINNSTLPSPSNAIKHSTSPSSDLSAKNSMSSAKQQQPSSSTPAPMPSTQQAQQFRCPVTLPSSLGIENSTLGISTAGTEVINNNERPQESQQAIQHGGLLDEYANLTTDNSLSWSGATDPELLDPIDKEMRDIETYLHAEIDQQISQKAAGTNSSATTFVAPPMQLQDPATCANINDDTQTDDPFKEITYEDLFPGDDDTEATYAEPITTPFNTDTKPICT